MNLEHCKKLIASVEPYNVCGKVQQIRGEIIEGCLPGARLGEICDIESRDGPDKVMCEVIAFEGKRVLFAPFGSLAGIGVNSAIIRRQNGGIISVGTGLLGRVIDGLGNPIDNLPPPVNLDQAPLFRDPPNPLTKEKIQDPIDLGVRVINGLFTCGKGQRIALMAGSGVGKSVLMGMIAQNVKADVNVIALIGERGREVREFIENDLGEAGLKRSVVVVVSSDQSPFLRIRGANLATAIAEYFRDKGLDVLLTMDSITRFAHAQREIGLAIKETPTTKGYTPSVFSRIPKLLERAGTDSGQGSITGIYTVLVDQDDFNDPVADAVRGTVDGHIVLDRKLAEQGIFPAIDLGASISRVMPDIVDREHWQRAIRVKQLHALYEAKRPLIEIQAYQKGSDAEIDLAIAANPAIVSFQKQDIGQAFDFETSLRQMNHLILS